MTGHTRTEGQRSTDMQPSCVSSQARIASTPMPLRSTSTATRAIRPPIEPPRRGAPSAGVWSAILPVLACAVCPACLTTCAKPCSASPCVRVCRLF